MGSCRHRKAPRTKIDTGRVKSHAWEFVAALASRAETPSSISDKA